MIPLLTLVALPRWVVWSTGTPTPTITPGYPYWTDGPPRVVETPTPPATPRGAERGD